MVGDSEGLLGAQSSPYITALAQLEVFGLLLYRPVLFLWPM